MPMDIINFEKLYTDMVAQGINPCEFGTWLSSYNAARPYAKTRSSLTPLSHFAFLYEDGECEQFDNDAELLGIKLSETLMLSMNMQICGCGVDDAETFAREMGEAMLEYEELMLVISLLPRINGILQACGVAEIPLTRAFWCLKEGQVVSVNLCNGTVCEANCGNGGVLLKVV